MANIWYIQVNRFCNNKCHFCSNPSIWKNMTFERWIELIDDFKERDYRGVIFTWWEPTLSTNLHKWIKYSNKVWMECRIISNWMACSDIEYVKELKKSWLTLVHFSLYSYIEKIHDFLTATPGSYKKVLQAIQNTLKMWITVQLNCVINKYNQTHIDKTVQFITKNFPQIKHFVWNNLDPLMMRKTKIAESTLPDYDIAWESLIKWLALLESQWKTYRVERLPLCFMRWFEHASTETRKIVKDEERIVYFLDERDMVKQTKWYFEHDKLENCKECDLNSICSWIYEYDKFYNYVEVETQKLSKEEKEDIVNKILWK